MAILDKLSMESMNSSGYLIRQEHGPFFKEDFDAGEPSTVPSTIISKEF